MPTDDARRAAAEQARRRAEFLAEASALMGRSLDYEITLQAAVRLCVPFLGDWCTVYLRGDDGEITRTAVACARPEHEALAVRLRRYRPTATLPHSRVARVLESGQSDLLPEIPDWYPDSIALDDEHREILRQLGFVSSLTVPLQANGRVLGALSFFSCQPERRFGESDLATAEELAVRIALAIENARLQREAQQAVQLRDDFLSAVAHDLKNPLTAAKAHVQMLQRQAGRVGGDAAEQMGRRIGLLEMTLDRMTGLIDELRDVASLQIGRPLQLRRERVDLVQLARRSVDVARQLSRRHRIGLQEEVESVVGVWDGVRVERVIDNLLSNAIKYSPAGGVVEVQVGRASEDGREWAVVRVRDQGIGIPADDLPRIFDRFHRGANVTGRIAGTGIGLAGAHQIVQQHGGRLTVETQEGVGSSFGLYLPIDEPG